MSHTYQVVSLPVGFETIASTESCPIAAMGNAQKRLFHAALNHPAVTKEALDYLDSAEFEYNDRDFPEQEMLAFSLSQLEELLKHELLADQLQKKAKECIHRGRRPKIDVHGADANSIFELLPPDFSIKEAPKKKQTGGRANG